MAQQVKNLTSIHGDVGSVPGLTQWVKDLVLPRLSCSVGRKCGSDLSCCDCGIGLELQLQFDP